MIHVSLIIFVLIFRAEDKKDLEPDEGSMMKYENEKKGQYESVVEKKEKYKNSDPDSVIDEEAFLEKKRQETEEDNIIEIESQGVKTNSIEEAKKAKDEGNDLYRDKRYDESIELYSRAIFLCPDDETKANQELKATFYGNRSAAYFILKQYDLVVLDCTSALELKQDYVKVLIRRMQAYEKLDKLEECLHDAKSIKEIAPTYPQINLIIHRLQVKYDERMEAMKEEALGKLKDLGNQCLGYFGMSLDDFKMQQDANTGSWSISMGQGGKTK